MKQDVNSKMFQKTVDGWELRQVQYVTIEIKSLLQLRVWQFVQIAKYDGHFIQN